MVEIHSLTEVLNEKMGITLTDADRAHMAKGGSGGAAAVAVQEEAVEEVKKTAFDLKLTGFDAKSKIRVIKEERAIAWLGFKEAKELVEGAPKVVMKSIKLEEAEKLKAKLEALGATIEIS